MIRPRAEEAAPRRNPAPALPWKFVTAERASVQDLMAPNVTRLRHGKLPNLGHENFPPSVTLRPAKAVEGSDGSPGITVRLFSTNTTGGTVLLTLEECLAVVNLYEELGSSPTGRSRSRL